MEYRDLNDDSENVENILDDLSKKKGSKLIKMNESRIPFIIVKGEWNKGYTHFIDRPDGTKFPVVCHDQKEGWSPVNCLIDKWISDGYAKARELKQNGASDNELTEFRKPYNKMKPAQTVNFIIVKGKYVEVEDPETQEITSKISWENPEVGPCTLNDKQGTAVFELVKDEKYPFIQSAKDLLYRVIVMSKKVDSKSTAMYKPTSFSCSIASTITDIHKNLGVDFNQFSVKDLYTPDSTRTEEGYAILTGEYKVSTTKLELEEDNEPTKDIISDLSDIEADINSISNSDDDFEDDIPY